MLKAYKYRIYPNKEQEVLINKTIGCCRFIFNHYLNERIEAYKNDGKSISYYDTTKSLTALKKELLWIKEVDAVALQQSLKDLDQAYKNFFKRIKQGGAVGFPKFKSKKNHNYSYTTNNNPRNDGGKGSIQISDRYIKLPKIGLVRVKKHRDFDGLIKSVTVSQNHSGKYYISVLVNQEDKEKMRSQRVQKYRYIFTDKYKRIR